MNLVDRVRNICVSPVTEWPVIEQETTPPADLVTGYLLPLAVVGAVAGLIGSAVVSVLISAVGVRVPLIGSLIGAVVGVAFTVIFCFVIAFIIKALAPTFGGQPDMNQALKTAVYSYTPALAAGITRVVPVLGGFVVFVASLYSLYVLYLGLPVTMKAPRDKAPGYTVVIVIASIIIGVMVSGLFLLLGGLGIIGAGML
jgi:Yip1-like protein